MKTSWTFRKEKWQWARTVVFPEQSWLWKKKLALLLERTNLILGKNLRKCVSQ